MLTLDEIAQVAMGFPDAVEVERHGNRAWNLRDKCFAWERPFTKADLKRFGTEPVPDGEILGVRVADLHEKEALLAAAPKGFFTIPHFDGYAAVLIQLRVAGKKPVREAL
ncbi:MAG TPA: hypothetical protein VE081_14490, partial [Sporichthyaceae bacterium]|nr:hypothetical protein [Sporichthyaceae bacterium]